MTRCLDEATLQCYFDGELSTSLMEGATSHLAACSTCALAAREIEQETSLLAEAFAAEFSASVPTERLRQRIDAAVLGERLEQARPTVSTQNAGFFSSLSSLLSFGSQRTLGYASLAVVIAFAAIFSVVQMRSSAPVQPVAGGVVAVNSNEGSTIKTPVVSPDNNPTESNPVKPAPVEFKPVKYVPRPTPTVASKPVKLLPGERAYLQAIARLDSTIKSDKEMRPALQAEYQRNLAVVDRAIAATRNAAKSNPSDPDAADFMFAAYQSKVNLLNTIADARVGGRSH
jgi:hypothetical protein